jgi:hypothetical protein
MALAYAAEIDIRARPEVMAGVGLWDSLLFIKPYIHPRTLAATWFESEVWICAVCLFLDDLYSFAACVLWYHTRPLNVHEGLLALWLDRLIIHRTISQQTELTSVAEIS